MGISIDQQVAQLAAEGHQEIAVIKLLTISSPQQLLTTAFNSSSPTAPQQQLLTISFPQQLPTAANPHQTNSFSPIAPQPSQQHLFNSSSLLQLSSNISQTTFPKQ